MSAERVSRTTISAEIARMRLQYGDDWLVTALVVTMTQLNELERKVKELQHMVPA